ncbi:Uncharacterized protein At4g02000 [Linum perenne]
MADQDFGEGAADLIHEEAPIDPINEEVPTGVEYEAIPDGEVVEEEPAVQFTEEDLQEARERAELSLLARIFWEEPRELRVVENSFIQVWKCGRVRIFDVGFGLYQFIFPSVGKRDWVLDNQPWFFQRAIINFTDNMVPSDDLFHALQFMSIWVKIIGLPFGYITIAVGRKLLAKLGEVEKVGYYDAGTPEGCYIKGRVRMDLLGSFRGTAPVIGVNGVSFPAFFQYIGLPCICFLCGWLGHVMADCSRTDLVFDENVRSTWISGKADQNEKESQGPQLQTVPFIPPPQARGRGGLPPSVAANLSSNLQRQWARDRQTGGARGFANRGSGGTRPFLALPGPGPDLIRRPGRLPRDPGPMGRRPHDVRPLQIMAPSHLGLGDRLAGADPLRAHLGQAHLQPSAAASSASVVRGGPRPVGLASRPPVRESLKATSAQVRAGLDRGLASGGRIEANRASSAPPQLVQLPVAGVKHRPGPPNNPLSTPQSKLKVIAVPGSSRRSTPSSGSVKRKLLTAFDSADGPDSPLSLGPEISGVCVKAKCGPVGAAESMMSAEKADQAGGPFLDGVENNSDTCFDPDALFVSGSEEGEFSTSGQAEEPNEVEVADPDRPPRDQ